MSKYLITLFFSMLISCVIADKCFPNQNIYILCDRINEIKILPFKGEHINDEVYNKILEKGNNIIPCLIDKVTNIDVMKDPRKAPPYQGITVGDIAFFIFLDITKQKIEYFFPDDLKVKYKKNGIYAYFEFVANQDNRKLIQENLREWLLKKRASQEME